MRMLSLLCLWTISAFAQSGTLGTFTNSGDVGDPSRKGSTEFDASNGQYRISGSGANIWAKQDGNFAITASMQFLGEGEAHRKAGIMFRQSLDADSPYADIVIHGNGMPGIQWRSNKGESTNGLAPACGSMSAVRPPAGRPDGSHSQVPAVPRAT